MWVNLVIADRLAPKYRSMGPEDELIARYQQVAGPYTGRIRVGVSLFFALIAGIGVSSQWQQWVLFTHSQKFGIKDPQFHKDIGFYVFQLPFLKFIAEWLFAGLVIVLIVTAVAHYLNGGIRFQSPFQRVTPQVKAHLSVILAVMALVKTAQYYLGRFELDFSTRGVVEGASYTDVKAQLPALNLLIVISIFAAGLFIWNIQRRGWVLPIIAVGLWGFVSIVIGTIYPAAIQQFKVGPNEFQTEQPYIQRNIRATRSAFVLDKVNTDDFNYQTFNQVEAQHGTEAANAIVDSNKGTIDNARLWDPGIIQQTYNSVQNLQTYYQIGDVDVDRYLVNNEVRQVLIAARGLNSADLPSQSFVNRHIIYTHGYGVVASPSNVATSDGSPNYYLQNIPTETVPNGIKLSDGKASQIYFAENLGSYVLVDAKSKEFNYQRPGQTDQFTRYRGKDGVVLSNIVRRAAFALRFGSIDPLISGQVTTSTKVLMERDIRARVEKLAPFLRYDGDPYPVAMGKHTIWVLDGYTTTSMYPYSQSTSGENGLATDFNYVRNSVKATVDAYEGTVTFYVFDPKDPIIKAWRSAFPDLFTDASQMSPQLRAHLRYPEDLFKVQSNTFGRYHVTEPRRFYDGSAKWLVSPDPGSGPVSSTDLGALIDSSSNTNANAQPQAATSTGRRIDPYYLYLKLPNEDSEHFIVIVPFVPVSSNNKETRLVSFLTANSDPGHYGQMRAFTMPQGETVKGPVQVNSEMNRAGPISAALTFLNQQGSRITRGSLQLIPVGNSLLYVRPFYAQGQGSGSFPQFQFVGVFTQDQGQAVCAQNVNDALNQLFGQADRSTSCNISITGNGGTAGTPTTTTTAPPGTNTTVPGPTTTTIPATAGSVRDLLDQAAAKFAQADAALAAGDLGQYQVLEKQGRALVAQAEALAASQ